NLAPATKFLLFLLFRFSSCFPLLMFCAVSGRSSFVRIIAFDIDFQVKIWLSPRFVGYHQRYLFMDEAPAQ
ncbi:hypothetical protein, partial [Aeromonas popoffii]|uniref:hypothetical protein n=1 Tax=Aeromonas popoffii TaxID=70856 RepID=UPI001AE01C0A